MNRLIFAILTLLYIFSGSGLTAIGLITTMMFNQIELNHISLFALTILLTKCFYGLIGLMYMFVGSMIFLLCGVCYWYEMSLNDIQQQMVQFKEENIVRSTSESKELTSFDKNWESLRQYKTEKINTFCEKIGLTDLLTLEERSMKIQTFVILVSDKFDKFCDIVYSYLCKFRTKTSDVKVFKEIYATYGQLLECKAGIESLRSMHKLSRTMLNMNLNMNTNTDSTTNSNENVSNSQLIEELDSEFDSSNDKTNSAASSKASTSRTSTSNSADQMFNAFDMEVLETKKQFDAMPEQEKHQINDMFKQMFGSMMSGDNNFLSNMMNFNPNTLGNFGKGSEKRK